MKDARLRLGAGEPGLVQLWGGAASEVANTAAGLGGHRCLRGSRMRTRTGLMEEWAAVAQFPPYFGGTWDALRDALSDLPEGGVFLVLDAEQLLADAPAGDLETLFAVLQAAREDLVPKPLRLILQVESICFESFLRRLQALGLA